MGFSRRPLYAGGDGGIVYSTANWSARGKGTDGAARILGDMATHVFERQEDGSLKLRLHTFNLTVPRLLLQRMGLL